MLYQRIKSKKLLATSLVIALSFSLFGCGQVSSVSEIETISEADTDITIENTSTTESTVEEIASSDITASAESEFTAESESTSESESATESEIIVAEAETIELETIDDEESPTATLNSAGKRDNSPVVYTPTASGITVYSNSLAAIDASNVSEGYIMVNYKGTNPKVKLQMTGSNGVTYTYNLSGGYEAFPLSAGSGTYKIAIYENVTGNQYSTALSQTITANITNTFGPYLYPNQYVNFNASSKVVAKAKELAAGCANDLEVVTKVYNYATTITYDYNKANTVQSGYTPNVDAILASGTGICFDYAAVMASMLRSQNIPTRLEVGYAGTAYHAWISTYIHDIGWVNGIISFDGTNWSLMDPTFAASTDETTLKNFIGDGTNYKTKYIY
jgi:transglutaminase-like putative cysteine protease